MKWKEPSGEFTRHSLYKLIPYNYLVVLLRAGRETQEFSGIGPFEPSRFLIDVRPLESGIGVSLG